MPRRAVEGSLGTLPRRREPAPRSAWYPLVARGKPLPVGRGAARHGRTVDAVSLDRGISRVPAWTIGRRRGGRRVGYSSRASWGTRIETEGPAEDPRRRGCRQALHGPPVASSLPPGRWRAGGGCHSCPGRRVPAARVRTSSTISVFRVGGEHGRYDIHGSEGRSECARRVQAQPCADRVPGGVRGERHGQPLAAAADDCQRRVAQ